MFSHRSNRMLAIISFVAILISTFACNFFTGALPITKVGQSTKTPVSTTQPTIQPASTSVNPFENAEGGGITFQYPTDLIQSVNVVQIAAETDTPVPHPTYTEFTLTGYPVYSDDVRGAGRILVYPIDEFINLSPVIADDLKALKELKAYELPKEMPFPHILDARPIFYERRVGTYLAGGISGYLYLTQFGQDFGPITNEGLTYVFVGQSENDLLIIAFFPVNAPGLPASFKDVDSNQWQNAFPEYIEGVKKHLRFLQPDDFTPSLSVLDKIIFSVAKRSNQSPNSSSSGPTLGSIEETQKAKDQKVETLTKAADEQYSSEVPVGGTRKYTIHVIDSDRHLLWFQGWCATNNNILAQNLKNMKFELQVNGQIADLNEAVSDYYERSDGWHCFAYSVVIYGWPLEPTSLTSKIIFLKPINDGVGDYKAGEITKIFTVFNP